METTKYIIDKQVNDWVLKTKLQTYFAIFFVIAVAALISIAMVIQPFTSQIWLFLGISGTAIICSIFIYAVLIPRGNHINNTIERILTNEGFFIETFSYKIFPFLNLKSKKIEILLNNYQIKFIDYPLDNQDIKSSKVIEITTQAHTLYFLKDYFDDNLKAIFR